MQGHTNDQRYLVENSNSEYVIVVGAEASPSESHAAMELRQFLFHVTGCKLPIVTDDHPIDTKMIIVGQNKKLSEIGVDLDITEFGEEGFIIKTSGPHLVLAGARQRGTLYAVYTFLEEKLGCRWYTPKVSYIPKKSTVSLEDLDKQYEPSFEWRMHEYPHTWDRDWSARNKLNGEWHALDKATGGNFLIRNTSSSRGFYAIMHPDKYFAKHPEYFSLVDGERRAELGQLCLTNPDVVKIVTEYVQEFFEQNPDHKAFGIIQNDWAGWCECPECQAIIDQEGANSGTYIRFINQVAEAIEKKHPGKMIYAYVYTVTLKPPRKVKPRANVILAVSHMHPSCSSHPVHKCEKNKPFMETVLEWGKITKKLYVKHYAVDFAHYMLPFPNFSDIAESTKWYKKAGVKGIHYQGASNMQGGGGEFEELRAYFVAKMIWNPDLDPDGVIDDFMNGYYGSAAPPIRDYFNMLHDKVRNDHIHMHLYSGPEAGYLTPEIIQQAAAYFEMAEGLADNDEILARVRKAKLAEQYAELVVPQKFVLYDGYVYPTAFRYIRQFKSFSVPQEMLKYPGYVDVKTILERSLASRQQIVADFKAAIEEFGVQLYREHRGPIDEFLEQATTLNQKYPALCINAMNQPVKNALSELQDWAESNKLPSHRGELNGHQLGLFIDTLCLRGKTTTGWLQDRQILEISDEHLWLRKFHGIAQ